uniref:protein-tyrosine-phosphatase n=1 Tax=Trichuris muris TaxID=70415 RepID=A0A5S6QFJ2_TRIMR
MNLPLDSSRLKRAISWAFPKRPMNSRPSVTLDRLISSEQLASIVAQSPKNKKLVLVDCRRFQEYNTGHIKGAINLCYSKLLKKRLQRKDSVVDFISNAAIKSQGSIPRRLHIVLYGAQKPAVTSSSSQIGGKATEPSLFLSFLVEQLSLSDRCNEVFVLKDSFKDFLLSYPSLCVNNLIVDHANIATTSCDRISDQVDGRPPEITCVLPFLYLGCEQDALDVETAKKFEITYLLNCTVTCPKPKHIDDKRFLRIPVRDDHVERLTPHFPNVFAFLNRAVKNGASVLVHCAAGHSRSPTFVVAYLMYQKFMSLQDAYRFVKQKRPCVSPNVNFWGQLVEYERTLCRTRQLNNDWIERPLTLNAMTQRNELGSIRRPPFNSPVIPVGRGLRSLRHRPVSSADPTNGNVLLTDASLLYR